MRATPLLVAAALGFTLVVPFPSHGSDEDYRKGVQLAKERRYREALVYLDRAAKAEPHRGDIHYNLGNVLFRLGEFPDAAKAYRKAISLNPQDTDAYFNLAMTYSVMDQMEEALEVLEELLRHDPEDVEAHYRLALGYYSLGQWKKAQEHILKAKELHFPVPPALEEAVRSRLSPESTPGRKKGQDH
jgi:tetratricopeptide (TPR) repeat protein